MVPTQHRVGEGGVRCANKRRCLVSPTDRMVCVCLPAMADGCASRAGRNDLAQSQKRCSVMLFFAKGKAPLGASDK